MKTARYIPSAHSAGNAIAPRTSLIFMFTMGKERDRFARNVIGVMQAHAMLNPGKPQLLPTKRAGNMMAFATIRFRTPISGRPKPSTASFFSAKRKSAFVMLTKRHFRLRGFTGWRWRIAGAL